MNKPTKSLTLHTFVIVLALGKLTFHNNDWSHTQPVSTVPDLIRQWGYPAEEHTLVTPDGYILRHHRIPAAKNSNKSYIPVVLGHCFVGSSAVWSIGPPENSLAYLLADEGYDVWMINIRGSTPSLNHINFAPDSKEFWDFGMEESATVDYAVSIDYVLNVTGTSQVYFAGYSMGTSQYLMLLSEKPEFNEKIRAGFLLGPTAFGGNRSDHAAFAIADHHGLVESFYKTFGIYDCIPYRLRPEVSHRLCSAMPSMCASFFSLFLGMNPADLDAAMVPYYMTFSPSGCSTGQFVHLSQLFTNGGRFAKYDYGLEGNLDKYGVPEPPEYQLDRITVPTALFSGQADIFSTPADAQKLANALPNLLHHHMSPDPEWSHTHFIWSKRAKDDVYDQLMTLLRSLG